MLSMFLMVGCANRSVEERFEVSLYVSTTSINYGEAVQVEITLRNLGRRSRIYFFGSPVALALITDSSDYIPVIPGPPNNMRSSLVVNSGEEKKFIVGFWAPSQGEHLIEARAVFALSRRGNFVTIASERVTITAT